MQIERLSLRRFKSLYDVDVPLEAFSLLTGPNGSGKSNFAAAIDFLGETYQFGLEYAVGRSGGVDSIAYRKVRRTTVPVQFSIRARLDYRDFQYGATRRVLRRQRLADVNYIVEHTFGIRPSQDFGDSTFSVSGESIRVARPIGKDEQQVLLIEWQARSGKRVMQVDRAESGIDSQRGASITEALWHSVRLEEMVETLPPTELLVGMASGLVPIINDYRRLMARLKVYRLNPAACRTAGILTPNATLERNGQNLPGVVARLRKRRRRTQNESDEVDRSGWATIVDSMAEIFPGLHSIDTAINSAGGLELQFYEQAVGRPWSAQEVSDGTIQYLALLAVMFDGRSPALIVEEPENALHSWMLRIFLEKCRNNEQTQVLITTHSPVALKVAKPEEVLLAWRRDGKTNVKPLVQIDSDASRLYEEEGVDVFEQYDSGFLPETLPSWGGKK